MNRNVQRGVAVVFLSVFVVILGCTRSGISSPLPEVAATGPAQPVRDYVRLHSPAPQQMPVPQQQPELTPEDEAKMEAEINALYQRLDAKVAAKQSEQWRPPVGIQNVIAASAPNAKIALDGCAKDFCRYTVSLLSEKDMKSFTKTFSVEGSILFNYPPDAPLSVVAYVFRPNADLSNL